MNYIIILGGLSIIILIWNLFRGSWNNILTSIIGLLFLGLLLLGIISGLIDLI